MSTEKKRPRPRTSSKTSPARLRSVERQAQALKLRSQGHTLEEIAKRLSYRSRQAVHSAIMSGLLQTLQEPAEQLRILDLERLDAMFVKHFARAVAGNVKSTLACLRIMERRAKLLGLDAPVAIDAKVDANHSGGVLVVPGVMDPAAWAAEAEKQQAELAALEREILRPAPN